MPYKPYKKRITEKTVLDNLLLMAVKPYSPALQRFISTFKCEIGGNPDSTEYLTSDEIVKILKENNINKKQITMGTKTKTTDQGSKWANAKEAVYEPNAPFFKFEEIGESIEGILTGKKKIVDGFKNENEHFVLKQANGESVTLPPHVSLNSKLNSIFDLNEKAEVYIELTGYTPLEGGRNANNYKVLYQ